VAKGIVYLRGEVERHDQTRRLIRDAGAVDGCSRCGEPSPHRIAKNEELNK